MQKHQVINDCVKSHTDEHNSNVLFFFPLKLEENVFIVGTSFLDSHIAMARNSPTLSNKTIRFGGKNPAIQRWVDMT